MTCDLKKCPSEITALKFLESVSFLGCKLTEFPSELRKCPKLTELNLQGNAITCLPREIVQFFVNYPFSLTHALMVGLLVSVRETSVEQQQNSQCR
jgi:Leucine-rich repeat (LRR) protein